MFKSLRKSRGYGKFVRNRAATIALAIITAYFLLAGWIIATEGTEWLCAHVLTDIGVKWRPSKSPVFGMLLAGSAEKHVGPKWVAGFGVHQSAARREDQTNFILEQVQKAMRAVDAKAPVSEEEARDILTREEFRLDAREIADKPLVELKSLQNQIETKFKSLDGLKRRREILVKADAAIVKIREQELTVKALPAIASADTRKTTLDDLGAAIEELFFLISDDYNTKLKPLPGATGTDPLKAIDLKPLTAAADVLRGDKPPATSAEVAAIVPEATLKAVATALVAAGSAIEQPLGAALDEIEPLIQQIMPQPTGFSGLIYKFKLVLGTDANGRSILVRSLYSAKIAIQVGCVVAIAAVLFGAFVGSMAGFFGGWVDHLVTWLYSTLSSLPQLVLLGVITFMFLGSKVEGTLIPIYAALTLTFWIGTARVVRGEVLKIKELEYVQAGKAIGFSRFYILFRHVLPNTVHLLFINFSLLFIGAVKSEVILTFLGLGIKDGIAWGLMITQSAPEVVTGFFWQIGAATIFMLILVLAFNVLSDALQDAFDPRHVG